MNILNTSLDALKAKAFTTWVKNQIGSEPQIRAIPYTKPDGETIQILEIVWTPAQRDAMVKWLDSQVGDLFRSDKEPGTIQMNFGDVLLPWSLRYLLPTGIAIFLLGRMSKLKLKGKRK